MILSSQGVPHLPSGPFPTMFAPNHITFHSKTLIEWSKTFKAQCLETKSSPKLGQYIVIHKVMHSLKEYNLPMYPEYTQEELSILTPTRK